MVAVQRQRDRCGQARSLASRRRAALQLPHRGQLGRTAGRQPHANRARIQQRLRCTAVREWQGRGTSPSGHRVLWHGCLSFDRIRARQFDSGGGGQQRGTVVESQCLHAKFSGADYAHAGRSFATDWHGVSYGRGWPGCCDDPCLAGGQQQPSYLGARPQSLDKHHI